MSAVCTDIDVTAIRRPHGNRAVVGLHHPIAVIAVAETEEAPFSAGPLSRHLAGQGAIEDVGVELSPAIHLEDAARRPGGEESEIQFRTVEDVLEAIQASADIREAEIADEPVRDAVALKGGHSGIFGCDFASIDELHAAQFERLPGDPAEFIEPYVSLLGKDHRGVGLATVSSEITGAEAKLPLRAWRNRVVWKAQEEGESELNLPVERLPGLAQAQAQNGARVSVPIISAAAKPVP